MPSIINSTKRSTQSLREGGFVRIRLASLREGAFHGERTLGSGKRDLMSNLTETCYNYSSVTECKSSMPGVLIEPPSTSVTVPIDSDLIMATSESFAGCRSCCSSVTLPFLGIYSVIFYVDNVGSLSKTIIAVKADVFDCLSVIRDQSIRCRRASR